MCFAVPLPNARRLSCCPCLYSASSPSAIVRHVCVVKILSRKEYDIKYAFNKVASWKCYNQVVQSPDDSDADSDGDIVVNRKAPCARCASKEHIDLRIVCWTFSRRAGAKYIMYTNNHQACRAVSAPMFARPLPDALLIDYRFRESSKGLPTVCCMLRWCCHCLTTSPDHSC